MLQTQRQVVDSTKFSNAQEKIAKGGIKVKRSRLNETTLTANVLAD
ncbi:MAG: hypothetical protein H0U45_06270 [Tatlockia sp.]|nr:hypothetical protein [Tatlockia sp.]